MTTLEKILYVFGAGLLAFGLVLFMGLVISMTGCALDVDHNLNVNINDDCLTALPNPDCSASCVASDGALRAECRPACLAGRVLICDPVDGPLCTQRVGEQDYFVPTLCETIPE